MLKKSKTFRIEIVVVLLMFALVIAACGGATAPTVAPSSVPTKAPAATAAPGATGAPTAVAATAPAGIDAAALVPVRCTVCHSTDRIKAAKFTLEKWTATVARMRGHGAQVNDAEAQAIIQYLAATYHP